MPHGWYCTEFTNQLQKHSILFKNLQDFALDYQPLPVRTPGDPISPCWQRVRQYFACINVGNDRWPAFVRHFHSTYNPFAIWVNSEWIAARNRIIEFLSS